MSSIGFFQKTPPFARQILSCFYQLKSSPKALLAIWGGLSSLAFAPTYILPLFLIGISVLLFYIKNAKNAQQAFIYGWIFGFSHFVIGLYWLSIGITIYINEFWWAIPFALIGLPFILAFFPAIAATISYRFKNKGELVFIYTLCISWVMTEWVRSWIFTGLPWNLSGYIWGFSDTLLQVSSIAGIYGLSFLALFVASNFYFILTRNKAYWVMHCLSSIVILLCIIVFGYKRLQDNPTEYTDISVRLVQPSIPQSAKWDRKSLYDNLKMHVNLSLIDEENIGTPDIIVWSEAAVTLPLRMYKVRELISQAVKEDSVLITGGVSEYFAPASNKSSLLEEYRLYSSIYGINSKGTILFNYHKTHLIPFGEYIPFKDFLWFKKLTAGFIDYSPGEVGQVTELTIKGKNIRIRPLICYEAIFPNEARVTDEKVQFFVNITNDSWYGHSSGPYQHFDISRLRSIENGLPMVRVGNNGISSIIDPVGRIIFKTKLDEISITDGFIPHKILSKTLYSAYGDFCVITLLLFTIIVSMCIYVYFVIYKKLYIHG